MPASNGSKLFRDVETLHPGRSGFDLSSEHKTMFDIGQLIPFFSEDLVPGDKIRLGVEAVLRFQPLVAPIMHRVDAFVHFWFVPYRLLWDGENTGDVDGQSWEKFITGGPDGDDTSIPPPWTLAVSTDTNKGTLWDYFGHPTGYYTSWDNAGGLLNQLPRAWQRRAYNLIYNENYRDENLQAEVDLDSQVVQWRAWEKDYFTSALPWQQRGTPPAFPVSGTTSAVFTPNGPSVDLLDLYMQSATTPFAKEPLNLIGDAGIASTKAALSQRDGGTFSSSTPSYVGMDTDVLSDNNVVDFANATTFTLADFRAVAAIQQWMERNARGGVRYTEFIRSHFGLTPQDSRLQRPEYIGGQRWPIITSEVLQTSGTGISDQESPQANMAGHGLGYTRDYSGSYYAHEYGIVVGIISLLARPGYHQGIRRNWRKLDRYSYYQPEFAHLSEQQILTSELYATGDPAVDEDVFGFQGQYDEYRYKPSIVTGDMRDTFNYWQMMRTFGNQPLLNSTFISSQDTTKRIFAVQDVPGIFADIGVRCEAVRPMPYRAIPGLMRI